ncbi:YdeI/OmpD-associated family protein [Streptacidiphilus sp. ASG 303]|uniref:YdeI/OmpD-associated family protein n=1 Tax=Streptacidiphilus sp. ASG 303 TaxID=2896847 RepID=UPI001E590F23|nr:YdeI/OmpD-associated family protein [Streptacidiphilus sp. ASG 303]MCD0485093.1 YdeI/OmpD-associated family protein [Streptacidiphilus sp. ASG 303]
MSEAYARVQVESREEWRAWLSAHHADTPGVWAVTWKAGSGHPRVPYGDLVEEALCFGWVDSVPRRVDDSRTRLLVTPRRPGSRWSRLNRERAERLTAQGLMAEAGLAAVAAARADGSWTALDRVEDLVEPDDLRAALDAAPDARRHWDAFPRSARRAVLEWIGTAKREATRAARVRETVAEAAVGRRANQWRQPKGAARREPPGQG